MAWCVEEEAVMLLLVCPVPVPLYTDMHSYQWRVGGVSACAAASAGRGKSRLAAAFFEFVEIWESCVHVCGHTAAVLRPRHVVLLDIFSTVRIGHDSRQRTDVCASVLAVCVACAGVCSVGVG